MRIYGASSKLLTGLTGRQVASNRGLNRQYCTQPIPGARKVAALESWDLDEFRRHAFEAQLPATLPYMQHALPRACSEWFVHDAETQHDLRQQPESSELRKRFWSEYETTLVPLELTCRNGNDTSTFHRSQAPLKLLLDYLTNGANDKDACSSNYQANHSMYLAQCELESLPRQLRDQIPTPDLVRQSGRGDIYSSSLWMGRPPTYTPLHRDPNPNLFMQLSGQKVIRLFPPDIGKVIFEDIQEQLAALPDHQGNQHSSASFRGEEMMQGRERSLLHRAVWGTDEVETETVQGTDHAAHEGGSYQPYALEAKLGLGEALFIPKGWWHSVKGIGRGVTTSVNWWFR